MSGGTAYLLDETITVEKSCNTLMISLQRLSTPEDVAQLKSEIQKHLELTESVKAREILQNWSKYEPMFWKVVPHLPKPPAGPAPSVASTAVPASAVPALAKV
jgi:glutamate synthase domain-containing protein 3